jgi:hemolysin activation/secretion protein
MKKGLKVFGWAILGFFAFCVLVATFSDDDSSATPTPTEQKQETEQQASEQEEKAERQAREQKEEAERQAREQKEEEERLAREEAEKETQKEEILKYGYKRGYNYGKSLQKKDAINKDRWCKECFLDKCTAPRTEEEKEFFEEFKDQFYKGWEDALF